MPLLILLAKKTSGGHRPNRRQVFIGAIAGVLQFTTTLLLYSSYSYIPVGLATTLHFLYPLYVVLYEVLFRGKKLSCARILSLAASLAGVLVCVDFSGGAINLTGAVLALISGVTFAAYILMLGYEARDPMPIYTMMTVLSAVGIVMCGTVGLLSHKLTLSMTGNAWLFAVLAALLVSVGASSLFQKGTRDAGETDAAVFSLLEPITSILFGWLVNGEALTGKAVLGCGLIMLGLLCNTFADRKES